MNEFENVTFLLCNPRSRSKWLNEVMHYAGGVAGTEHDPLRFFADIADDFRLHVQWMAQKARSEGKPLFIADSGAILFVEKLVDTFPGARFLFVYRDPEEVRQSLANLPMPYFTSGKSCPDPVKVAAKMHRMHAALSNVGVPVFWVSVDRLDDHEVFSRVLAFVGARPVSPTEHQIWCRENITADLSKHRIGVDPYKQARMALDAKL